MWKWKAQSVCVFGGGGVKQTHTWRTSICLTRETWKKHTQDTRWECAEIQMWITSVWSSHHLSRNSLTLDQRAVPLTASQVVHSTSWLVRRAEDRKKKKKKVCVFSFLIIDQHKNVTSIKYIILNMCGQALKFDCTDHFLELWGCWGGDEQVVLWAVGVAWGRMWVYYTEWACCVTNTTRLRCGFAQRCNAWLGDYRKVLLCSSVRNNY